MKKACSAEIKRLRIQAAGTNGSTEHNTQALVAATQWIGRGDETLSAAERERIDTALSQTQLLALLMQMRNDLTKLWDSSTATSDQLLHELQAWCLRAQQSGIASLEEFALRLRRYAA